MRHHTRKARIELLTLFLLSISFGMGIAALGGSPSNNLPATPVQSPPAGTYFDHVVFIMMENEGIYNICGGNPPPCNGSNTPFMDSLATNYTVAQQYTSVYRPITSAPNYVAIIGASTFNCTAACPGNINAPTLIDRFLSVGLTWKGYFENMGQPTGCVTGGSSPYNSSHNPFISFKEFVNNGTPNATMCNSIVLANPSGCGSVTDCKLVNDLNNASSTAPSFLWLTPNDCNNMHADSICTTGNGYNGCTTPSSTACIKGGDNYLKSLVPNILNSRTFKNTRSALFVTFDEGQDFCPFNGSSSEDCIYSSWSGPVAKTGFVAPSAHLYNHYNFTRTVEVNWSLATLTTHDAGSGPMTEFFSTQPPDFTISASPSTISFPTGGSANSTITLQSTSGFSGTVTLTKSSSPTGLTLSLNPTSVTLTSGGTATSTLTISSTTLGSYTATVKGTSGSLSHNTTLSINVTPPPNFAISANPASLTLGQVSNGASNPVVVTPTGDQTVFESSYLANSFYAKGLYWLFYEDSQNTCEHMAGCLEYTTSTNGSTWTTPTTVPVHITDSDFSVYTDGSNIYYVRYNETTFQNNCGRNLQFRQGSLSTSGTVTWQAEQTIIHASSTRFYVNPYLILDSNGQAWVGFLTDSHGACGGTGNDTPQVAHSSGTNYASWTGFFNLTLAHSSNWHVALASLGSGQVYASYWIVNTDVHGRLYNGSWQADEQISSPSTLADVNSWMFSQGTNVYTIYFDNQTETYNYATRSSGGTWTTTVIGTGETHTGTKAFNSNYYSLPDAAGYDANANRLYLFYMNSTTHKVDEWSGTGSTWTRTNGIVSTGTVPYADSITSFVQASSPSTGAIFYISGSGSPFNLNAATLTFATNSTTGNFQTIITAQNGFTGTVNLTTTITPSTGLTVTCNPATITGGSGASNCLVNSTVPGNYTVTVTGTSGSLNHSTTVAVNAPGSPDFTISASAPSPANADASTTTTITITAVTGFTGTVSLSDTVPTGLVCGTITPSSVTGSGTATVTCHSATAGNYTLTITGTSGSLVHTATTTFRIQDFTIGSTTTVTANAGANGTTTATITALNGFGGTISLTDTIPTGLTCGSITPSSITGSGSSTIACSASLAGNYTLTITGTSASLVHASTTLFIVQNFTITATSPSPVNVSQSAVSTITITAQNHFAGVVTLTDSIPSGLSCGSITPGSITGSGSATVSCSATVSGNYTLTITGTSGSLVHTATAIFRFQDYTVTALTPLTANAGSNATSTITITSLNGFGGTVTMTDTVPSGLTCGTITPTSITGQGTATIACRSNTAGNYTLTVTATSASLVHSATVLFIVQNYTITATSPAAVNAGQSAISTITITAQNHFAGTVTLTDIIPTGLTCGAITPGTVTGSGTATVSCSAATAGNYTLTITATNGQLVHTATATFQFRDFTITATTPVTATAGSNGSSTITIVALNHFSGTVSLTDSIPSGLVCGAISPSSVTGSGTATVACSSTIAGNYTLTVTGTSTTLTHTATITFIIQDFSITASSPAAVYANSLANSTITISSQNHLSGIVILSNSSPSDLTCNPITPNSVAGSGSATLSCKSAVAGNYTVTITGTSGLLAHNATAIFRFQDFTVAATTPTPANAGTNSSSTITLSALNGFAGSITLTSTVPSNLSCGPITPNSLTGQGTATISCTSSLAGNYTLTITSNSGSLVHTATTIFRFQDFTISSTTPITVNAGTNSTTTVTIAALNGFGGIVSLADTVPSGLACGSITPNSITGSGGLSIACSANTAGNYTLTITGTSASLVHTTTTLFIIQNFTMTATNPNPVNAGQSATSTITITAQNHFMGLITLTDSIPTGLSCGSITPGSLTGSGTATVSCSATAAGNYTLTITANSGSLVHTATTTFRFQDYTITTSTPISANAGANATIAVTITALNGFAGTVTLADTIPSGLACGPIIPVNITRSGAAAVTCHSATAGNYTLTLTGTSGSLVHSASSTFQIRDFTLTSSTPVIASAGSNATSTITIAAQNQFVGTVSLTDSIPSSLICGAISPSSVTGSGTATVACSSTTPGNYTLTVTGTSTTLTHSAVITFIIQDFTITASSPVAVNVSQSAVSTIAITAQNHFAGVVILTDSIPAGLSCGSITPSSLTGSGTATLSCSATTAGNYTITITGKNGSLTHTATAIFRFQDYTITATTPMISNVGSNSLTTITITPLNGFAGSVNLTDTIPSGLACGPITPASLAGSGSASIACTSTIVGNYTLTVTATSASLAHSVSVQFIVQDFTVTASSPAAVYSTQSTISTITVVGLNHFAGTVTLTDSIPNGLTCGPITPGTVSGSGTATVSCSATIAGNYTLTITGTSSSLTRTATATFTIEDFSVTATPPPAVEVTQFVSINIAVSSQNRFAGTVTLTASVPGQVTCGAITPSTVAGSGSATISCTSFSAGNYTITITGRTGSLIHSVPVRIQAIDFNIAAPASTTMPVGSNSTLVLALNSLNGYNGNLTLTASVMTPTIILGGGGMGREPLRLAPPATGPTLIINPSFVILSGGSVQANLTIILPTNLAPGTYPISITVTDGWITRTATITLNATDYTITVGYANLTIQPGGNYTETITLQSLNGFQGNITLTWTITPNGPTATISPSTVYLTAIGNTASITITVPSNTLSGNYTLTVQAASGALARTLNIVVQVPPGGMTAALLRIDSSNNLMLLATIGSVSIMAILPVRNMRRPRSSKKTMAKGRNAMIQYAGSSAAFSRSEFVAAAPLWTSSARRRRDH